MTYVSNPTAYGLPYGSLGAGPPMQPSIVSPYSQPNAGDATPQGNAGRGFGNFSNAIANGGAMQPMNPPAAASPMAARPQNPSVNQGLLQRIMSFGQGGPASGAASPGMSPQQGGLLSRIMNMGGTSSLGSLGNSLNIATGGVPSAGQGGALSNFFNLSNL